MSIQALSDYTFVSRYARYNPEKKRRETWEESVDRVMDMHREKYLIETFSEEEYDLFCDLEDDIEKAGKALREKKILGSQRALQFGGSPILTKNARIYNCCGSFCDRPRFFQEAFWLLLCGCGTGFSVQKHHVDKLPELVEPNPNLPPIVFKPEDSIEGWAECVGVLLASFGIASDVYKPYVGRFVDFDLSLIREEGAPLSSSSGKAPGPEPLRVAIRKVRTLLEDAILSNQIKLKPINCYDIVMHFSDAVLAGGVRRSATICIFSPDDLEMVTAKTGDWFVTNPQRGRSNNSALLLRNETSYEDFFKLIESVREYGEPGFWWAESTEMVPNPCQPAWAKVVTPDGIRELGEIKEGDIIWSETGWTTVVKKWSTGIKPVYRYETNAGVFYGTENHKVVSSGEKVEVKDAESIDILRGPYFTRYRVDPWDIMDGLVVGDGTKGGGYTGYLCIGEKDSDYFSSEIKQLIGEQKSSYVYSVQTTISPDELPETKQRRIPERFLRNPGKLIGFLRGLYSANGSVVGERITLKTASKGLAEDVQLALSSLGIRSYKTTNKAKEVEFSNGIYLCNESYDINITAKDKQAFRRLVGFIQKYKNDKITTSYNSGKESFSIVSVTKISEEEVFDITVDNQPHTYWTGGLNVSNCSEITFHPVWQGITGWHFCNLSEINGKFCKTKEDLYTAAEAAAILGTLQAGYTNFPYLGAITEAITTEESLLGVSITGIMDNPEILLNPEYLRKAAEIVLETNKRVSALIGIKPTARATCVKPSGTASCLLGTASGVHPHHARRYFRRVQSNKAEAPLQYFREVNPSAVEDSKWSANNTDSIISFCVEVPEGARVKNQMSGLELLDKVRLIYENWVLPGKVEERCIQPYLSHNVSNTIHVKEDEWDDIAKYIYENRNYFSGISLLPLAGDKDYTQAPFCAVYTPREMVSHYGDGAVLCSGVIEWALEAFGGDLWKACDVLLGNRDFDVVDTDYGDRIEKHHDPNQLNWYRRAEKFAIRYFVGDRREMSYCLKDVHNWKRWLDLTREYKEVDYRSMVEEEDNTSFTQEAACAGGQCLV